MNPERQKPFQPEGRNLLPWATGPVGIAFSSSGLLAIVHQGVGPVSIFFLLLGAVLIATSLVFGAKHRAD
jgi:hypothetical protein